MLERVLSLLAAVAVPTLGLLLQASRRNRLQRRIDEHLRLAERVRGHDADAAAALERFATEAIRVFVVRDERWLRQKIDPNAVVALLFLTVPGVVGVILSSSWDSDWKWPVMGFCAVWTLLWVLVGTTQLKVEARGDSEAERADREVGAVSQAPSS